MSDDISFLSLATRTPTDLLDFVVELALHVGELDLEQIVLPTLSLPAPPATPAHAPHLVFLKAEFRLEFAQPQRLLLDRVE